MSSQNKKIQTQKKINPLAYSNGFRTSTCLGDISYLSQEDRQRASLLDLMFSQQLYEAFYLLGYNTV
jgi:hypothetical protein